MQVLQSFDCISLKLSLYESSADDSAAACGYAENVILVSLVLSIIKMKLAERSRIIGSTSKVAGVLENHLQGRKTIVLIYEYKGREVNSK